MKRLFIMLAVVFGMFALTQKSEAQPHGGYYDREFVRCDSNGFNYRECGAYNVRRIDRVRLVQQHSKTSCYYGSNWGYSRWSIWVNNGCRATFEVTGWTR